MTYKVVVEGFNTLSEAQEFCSWYSGQGETDAEFWFECSKLEGKIPSESMLCKKIVSDPQTVYMQLEMY